MVLERPVSARLLQRSSLPVYNFNNKEKVRKDLPFFFTRKKSLKHQIPAFATLRRLSKQSASANHAPVPVIGLCAYKSVYA